MTISNTKATVQKDIHKVWEVILDFENYSWRSDLSKVKIVNENKFIEYTKNGYPTTFVITNIEPYKKLEFDIDNENLKGHWIGIFSSKGNKTEMDFTESVTTKKILLKPFLKLYLKKQQAQFILDLKKKLLTE